MDKNSYTGVCFCSDLNGHSDSLIPSELASYAKSLKSVTVIWYESDLPLTGSNQLSTIIRDNNLNRIVIAGKRPGHLKPFFTKAMVSAGKAPEDVLLASFKEHGALAYQETDRAKAILACAMYGVPFEVTASPKEAPVHPDTVVIGAVIAGIQVSLEIADSGNKVFFVEKTGTIGGYMAMFDKTFPTLDCAACILTPKMVQVSQHPNIELLTSNY